MNGIINLAIEDFVRSRAGESALEAVHKKCPGPLGGFLRTNSYGDDVTNGLAAAACEVLGLSPDVLLFQLGEHFVEYVGRSGYEDLLKLLGTDFPLAIQNLDRLHAWVARAYPESKTPRFECTDVGEDTLVLRYHSPRTGLRQLVEGLLHGLAKSLQVRVRIEELPNDGTATHVFRVQWSRVHS